MTCREMIDFLADYLDGELPADARRTFDQHLQDCSHCRSYLSQYRSAIELAKRSASDEPTEQLPDDLVRAILASAKK